MYKILSDSTLMSLTKKQLVEQLRIAEHNWFGCEERVRQQYENTKDWMPVTRCKDCKHWGKHIEGNCAICDAWSRLGTVMTQMNQWCCYGEQRGDK